MIIRFDDICLNTNQDQFLKFASIAHSMGHEVWGCISLFCHSECVDNQRVYPAWMNAHSDFRNLFCMDIAGNVELPFFVRRVSHGLVHCDHRLLTREQQEMSILLSCHAVGSNIFVPPHNKWNWDTESICEDNSIDLVKFEDGWLSMEHNTCQPWCQKYYLHHRNMTLAQFTDWLDDCNNTSAQFHTLDAVL